jgi:type I restriction enzyme S subunit
MSKAEPIYGTLPSQWKMVTINELIEEKNASLQTGPFGTMLHASAYKLTGIPVVAVQHLGENRLLHTDMPRVDDETYQRLIRYQLQAGDIIFGRKGSVERRALIRVEEQGWLQGSDCIRLRLNPSAVNPAFVSYVLGTKAFREWIIQHAHGATMPSLNQEILGRVPLPFPTLQEQCVIAEVLGALDDKIELNRRMNHTLESMARAVFRQWFVEKEENNWEEKSLDEVADFLNGLALQKFPPEGNEYLPVIKIAQLRKNDTKDADKASTNIPSECIIEDGDILFSWSGSLEVVVWCGGKGALNQHLFKVTSEQYPKWFYYYWTKYHLPDFQEIAAGKATTMGHIQRHHLRDAKVLVPREKEMREMDNIMSPLLEKIINNEKESRTLASLRDALLPKLMRGEVRVKL